MTITETAIGYNDIHFRESCRLVKDLVESLQIEEDMDTEIIEEKLEFHRQKLTDRQNEKLLGYYADLLLGL